jgi:hypothetical protein
MNARRVVAGQTASGESKIVADEETPEFAPGVLEIWGSDQVTTLPTDGTKPPTEGIYPSTTGYRVGLHTVPAQSEFVHPEPGSNLPTPYDMHKTDTIDVIYLVKGQLGLRMENGDETLLNPGDFVVQNGAVHQWTNESGEAAIVLAFFVGAERSE